MKGLYTQKTKRKGKMERQAFLDDLAIEAVEDAYQFRSVDEAVNHLTSKYELAMDEIKYLKKTAKKKSIGFVEKFRKEEN